MDKIYNKNYFIGITGTIGSGKTTVSNILRNYGYSVFDTDLFSKKILNEEKVVIENIENIVNQTVTKNSKIDFKKVGEIFDNNPHLEEKFEDWYQIFLGKKIVDQKLLLPNTGEMYFFDIPLLWKKNIINVFDYLWIINSKETNCYERIKKRNNYTDKKIQYLIQKSKINKEQLLSNCKIIDNNKSIETLRLSIKSEIENMQSIFKLQ